MFFGHLSIRQIVLKNTFWLALAHFVAKVLKFFLIPFAARILGPGQYGTFAYTTSLILFFFSFSDLGLNAILIREFQKKERPLSALLDTILTLKLALGCIGCIAASIGYFLLTDPLVKTVYFILLLHGLTNWAKDFLFNLAQAHNRMEYQAISFIIEAVLVTFFGILILLKTRSFILFCWVYLISSFIAFLILTFFLQGRP